MADQNVEAVLREGVALLRLHQQRSRFVDSAYESPLSLVEAYLIIEIDIDTSVSVRKLCTVLGLEKGAISRALARLEDGSYIKRAWSPADQRERRFQLTAKARKFLELHDQQSRSFLSEHLSKLSITEIAELQRFQHLMCDAAGAPPVRIRTTEHPFEEGIRRVTRGLGFIGPSLFGSGYSSTVWQVLAAIHLSPAGKTLSTLASFVGMVPSSLSQVLSRYEEDGWLVRMPSKSDKRVRELALTPEGCAVFERIERCGVDLLARAFKTEQNCARFVEILKKHLGVTSSRDTHVLRERLEIIRALSDEERRAARGFVVFHAVRLRRYLELPETIIGRASETFVLVTGTITSAVCEIERSDEGDRTVTTIAHSDDCTDDTLADFLNAVVTLSHGKNDTDGIRIRHDWITEGAQKKLPLGIPSDGFVRILPIDSQSLTSAA